MPQDLFDQAFKRMGVDQGRREVHTLLPDPEPREVRYTVISVDDHLVEPPDLFEGRMPAKFADRTPRIVESDDGAQLWSIEGRLEPNVGMNAIIGRPKSEWGAEPTRFDEMRRGAWDIDARIHEAWSGHPRRLTVDSTADFIDKAARALALVRDELPPCCHRHPIPQAPSAGDH